MLGFYPLSMAQAFTIPVPEIKSGRVFKIWYVGVLVYRL